jgi:hypothetical protein
VSALEKLRKAKAEKAKKAPAQKAKKPALKVVPKSAPKKVAKTAAKSAPKKAAKAVVAKKKAPVKTAAKKAPEKAKKIITAAEIKKMSEPNLNILHDQLPGEIDNWEKLNKAQKVKALIEAVVTEEDENEEELSGTEDEEDQEEASDEDSDEDSEEDEGAEDSEEADDSDEEEDDTPDSDDEEEDGGVGTELDDDEEEEGKAKKAKLAKRKFDPNDLIDKTVKELSNLTESQADEELSKTLAETENTYTYFRLGGILSVIKAGNFIGEHENFRAKVEAEFDMKYRKADYLIQIYENLVASGVKWNDVKSVGWTKLKEIAHLITKENVKEWVEKANSMNKDTLIKEVKLMEADDGEDISAKLSKAGKAESVVTTMTFKVHADQKETIDEALTKAKELGETEANTVALEYICADFISGSKKVKTRDMTIKQMFQKLVADAKGKTEEARLQNALETLLEGPEFEAVFGHKISEIDFDEE